MLKRILLTGLLAALTATMGHAFDQKTTKIVIPVGKTSSWDGKQMYTAYCAPCHGVDGRGHGPAASALKVAPADLSNLAKMNHGKFPDTHLLAVLQFGVEMPAHGSVQMPVWGPILASFNRTSPVDGQLRASNLVRYLQTLQAK